MSLFPNNFDAFGLDIGDRSLKAAWVKKVAGRPRLLSYGAVAVAAGICERGEIKNQTALSELIKKLVKNIRGKKIKTRYVHACLPENQTFIKLLTLECPRPAELADKIRQELPNHFPAKTEELYLDWQIIKQNQATYKIVVAAAPRPLVESYTACLVAAGLTPVSLQVEPEAILRGLLSENLSAAPVIIIDFGATRSSFICWAEGAIQFTVSLPFSGEALTQLLAQTLKISAAQAEKAKIACGLGPDCGQGIVAKILHPALAEMVAALKKNLSYYQEHFARSSPLPSLLLCGGGANLKHLSETLKSELGGIAITPGNPLINLDERFPPAIKITTASTTALGLALANIL